MNLTRQGFSDGTDTDQLNYGWVGSDRRRSATSGEPVGNRQDEKRDGGDERQRFTKDCVGQHRVKDGHEELAVGEVLDDAVVVRRVVVRVQARVRLGTDREEADRHQRAYRRQGDEEPHGRKAVVAAELQIGCK